MSDFRLVNRLTINPSAERCALVAGLTAPAAAISPSISTTPSVARSSARSASCRNTTRRAPSEPIFREHRDDIAEAIGRGRQFVDLGAGDCCKAQSWLPFLAPSRYVAVDIAGDALAQALARMAPEFPELELTGIVADFTHGLDLRRDLGDAPSVFFYPGSSIGNFTPDEALAFLADIHLHCIAAPGSGLLIGVDTKKDARRLTAAYDDALGVTAAFNRNVLRHVNRVIGSDFDPAAFEHVALYDAHAGRIEMHLEARLAQVVHFDGMSRAFAAGERIHTENSYKYAPAEFAALLQRAGFARVRCWQDAAKDFAVFYAA